MKADLIGVIEATYLIEQTEHAWLNGVLHAARPIIDDAGMGAMSFTYDATDPAAFRLSTFVSIGLSPEDAAFIAENLSRVDSDYVRRSFLSLSCGTASEVSGWREQPGVDTVGNEFGIRDTLTINGMNPDGQGCAVVALLPAEMVLSSRRRNVLAKISCHLAAAHRLRERLAITQTHSGSPDAILGHDGRVHHAEGEARSKTALTRLQDSARAIAHSRGDLRVRDPEQAVDEWKGLIAARWTLLEVSETHGRRYLVARQNRPRARGSNELTEREREVVAFAAMGHHNKLIAYNLGISHSTVRVLIARAAGKLGARSRGDLIQRGLEVDAPSA